ncbi:hypothetical protein D3C71_1283250 [compost metagenome]
MLARLHQVDVFPGHQRGAFFNAHAHPGVVAVACALQQLAVPGVGFGGGKTIGGLLQHGGQVDGVDLGARLAQGFHAALKGARHGGIQPFEEEGGRHRQPVLRQRRQAARHAPGGQHLVRHDGVAHGARHGAGSVQGGGQRHGASGRHQPGGVLEAHDAVERRRNADGAAGVRSQSNERGASGDRHPGAGRRPAGHPGCAGHGAKTGVPGSRRAVVGVDAHARESELHHVGAANQAGTRCAQPGHGRAVLSCSGSPRQRGGARRGGLAGHVKQVLYRHRQPGQRQLGYARLHRCGASLVEQGSHKAVGVGGGLGSVDAAFQLGGRGSGAVPQLLTGGDQVREHGCARIFGFCWEQ